MCQGSFEFWPLLLGLSWAFRLLRADSSHIYLFRVLDRLGRPRHPTPLGPKSGPQMTCFLLFIRMAP